MTETLGQKQRRFTRLVGLLIEYAYAHGMELTFSEARRTPEQAAINATPGRVLSRLAALIEGAAPLLAARFRDIAKRRDGVAGIDASLHVDALAVDLNLFIGGKWQSDSAAYRPLGDYWEGLSPDAAWGGRFDRPDGNHFSLRHGGRA